MRKSRPRPRWSDQDKTRHPSHTPRRSERTPRVALAGRNLHRSSVVVILQAHLSKSTQFTKSTEEPDNKHPEVGVGLRSYSLQKCGGSG